MRKRTSCSSVPGESPPYAAFLKKKTESLTTSSSSREKRAHSYNFMGLGRPAVALNWIMGEISAGTKDSPGVNVAPIPLPSMFLQLDYWGAAGMCFLFSSAQYHRWTKGGLHKFKYSCTWAGSVLILTWLGTNPSSTADHDRVN